MSARIHLSRKEPRQITIRERLTRRLSICRRHLNTSRQPVTDYYKNDDTIIAIDLKNEPHGKPEEGKFAKWDDSKDQNNWKYAAEQGAMACLNNNPNLLIMVEGVECYPKFEEGADWSTPSVDYANYDKPSKVWGAWWGANLRGVKDHPVDIGQYNKQIVYSPHDYGPGVWEQKWFYLDDPNKTFILLPNGEARAPSPSPSRRC